MKSQFWRGPQAVLLTAALTLGLGVAGVAAARLNNTHSLPAFKLADASEGVSRTSFAPVVKKVLPAVVAVSSSKLTKIPTEFFGQMPDDPMFRQFFGNQQGRRFNAPRDVPEQRERGLGSGVIVTPDGYILTNNHVVEGASDIKVTLADKRVFTPKVVGTDPKTDIAVLKIDAANLPCVRIGDSSKVQVGDFALAIGDPFGVGQTVTMGIVSATGRSHLGIEDYEDFIQTDAPINPGNSGGALVNEYGDLIGINTAIIAHGSEGNQGIGFAVPVNLARTVMDEIVEHGKVTRAYLGILPQDVTPAIAKAFGKTDARGALVGDVTAGSPAQKSGLEKGDIILQANGKPVEDSNALRMTISMMQPGSNVNLKVFRNGSERQIAVTLTELPTTEAPVRDEQGGTKSSLSGVSVETITPETAHDLNLPAGTNGVVVNRVNPTSAAADAGLRKGDVIQEVNRKPIRNETDFENAVRLGKGDNLLLVNRSGNTMYLAV